MMFSWRGISGGLVATYWLAALTITANPVLAGTPEIGYQAQINLSAALERGGKVQKNEINFEPRLDIWFENGARLTSIGRVRGDLADELEPGRPSNDARALGSSRLSTGEHVDIELRELFLDFAIGETQLRLGKQQVVWGQADGLRILDVVNPLSYREFILPDFEDRRIPTWMVNAELNLGATMLQLLWIPDQTYDEFPESDSAFSFTSTQFRPPLNSPGQVLLNSADKPNNWLEDSDVGARLSAFVGGWDLTANYLYHYQDQPVLTIHKQPQTVELIHQYYRTHLLGGSASKAFGDFVFRGELGFSTERRFAANIAKGFDSTHEISGVFGLDYSGFTDLFVSAQYFQSTIDRNTDVQRPHHERRLSLLIRRDFANDTLTFEILSIHDPEVSDGVVQAELAYQMTSNVELSLGADLFYGDRDGVFGQFDARDRMELALKISL